MKHLDEYRDRGLVEAISKKIHRISTQPWTLMEVCGGQTHSIVKYGLEEFLPKGIRLSHGPGCPVCVTPVERIDAAIEIAKRPEVLFTSFGDMLRVPGTKEDLLSAKAQGADVRFVYSPMDALKLAKQNSDREVVFFAVGFETTAPANAMTAFQAKKEGIRNFSLLTSQVTVPVAIRYILEAPGNTVQAFLAAGHVCTVMGFREYEPIVEKYQVPIAVTGFEPVDIMRGILSCIEQLESGTPRLENLYSRSVKREGNEAAQAILQKVFIPVDRFWRGIGLIPESGLDLSEAYAAFDAKRKFGITKGDSSFETETRCRSGDVLLGKCSPSDCEAFGKECTPEKPLGATMVSNEGACAAYFQYQGVSR